MFRTVLLVCLFAFCAAAAGQELRVGMSPDYPPLVYRQDGRVVGIEPDNMRAVGEILNLDLQVVELPFEKLIPALEAGEIDIVMSGMSITEERAARVTFCDPYMEVGQMVIMHRDKVAEFAQPWSIYREGIRVGVEPGTTGEEFAERELTGAEILRFDNPAAAFSALRNDVIDLYVHDAPTSWQLASDTSYGDLISQYSPLTSEALAWAVGKKDTALAERLNDALSQMKANGTLRYILNRWIPVTVEVR